MYWYVKVRRTYSSYIARYFIKSGHNCRYKTRQRFLTGNYALVIAWITLPVSIHIIYDDLYINRLIRYSELDI